MFKVLDLFSGIGGFSLGLERTGGFKTVAFCEIDNYCQRVLHKHWPEVYIHSDIRTLTAKHFDGYQRPDVICGGFPCQDISNAGARAGISGNRSGLWSEYARLIGELQPRFVIVENVAALLGRGLGRVLGDLASCGYDAEWDCIPASAFGAPHRRDRVWIVAYPYGNGRLVWKPRAKEVQGLGEWPGMDARATSEAVPDADSDRPYHSQENEAESRSNEQENWLLERSDTWRIEPNVGRVVDGVPARVDRLRALGNAIVPQISTWIGERILECQ